MRSRGRILVACVSLAGYLLALAGTAVFHDHAHHDHSHAAAAPATPAHADSGHSHAHGCCHTHECHTAPAEHHSATPPASPAPAPAHHHDHSSPDAPHDDCPICQFLALKVLASSPPATVAGAELVAETAAPVASIATPAPCWRPLSRGPPANA